MANIWLASACLLVFPGYLRFVELGNIKVCELRDPGYLTYSKMRELLKAKLKELGFLSEDLISIASGATAAAKAGIPDRDFLSTMGTQSLIM